MLNPTAALLVCCGAYLIIVVVTNRGFIVAPRARLLVAQAQVCDARAKFLADSSSGDTSAVVRDEINAVLKPLTTPQTGWGAFNPFRWIAGLPLTRVAEYAATVDAAETMLVDLIAPDDLDACWGASHQELQQLDADAAKTLAAEYGNAKTTGGRRLIIRRAREVVDERAKTALSLEFDRQRVAFWLAAVGLSAIIAVGIFLDHELTMLVGALGGFLAPVVSTLTSKRASVWGVMVLSPVGGALTAVGGMLLVRFLADPGVGLLGQTFATYWQSSNDPPALALALLFGFSGRLFSRLAISATSQVGSDQPAVGGNGPAR
jgi:hypothetical protein